MPALTGVIKCGAEPSRKSHGGSNANGVLSSCPARRRWGIGRLVGGRAVGAKHERLPWETDRKAPQTPTGLRSCAVPATTPLGLVACRFHSQGSSCLATSRPPANLPIPLRRLAGLEDETPLALLSSTTRLGSLPGTIFDHTRCAGPRPSPSLNCRVRFDHFGVKRTRRAG